MSEVRELYVIELLLEGKWVPARDPKTCQKFPEFEDMEQAEYEMSQAFPKLCKMQQEGMPPAVRTMAVVLR